MGRDKWISNRGSYALQIFIYFAKNICHQFHFTSAEAGFDSYQILLNITKLQKRCCPASEQDKFLYNENLVDKICLHFW